MTRQQRETRDGLRKAVKQAIRDSERAELVRLAAELKRAKARKARAMAAAVRVCRARRRRVADYRKRRRADVRAELAREFEALKCAARRACAARKARVKRGSSRVQTKARASIAEERRLLAELRRLENRKAATERKRVSAAERRSESDDAVTQNLPPELHPVFRKVRRAIVRVPGMSRTESFLKWAEEHPGEVVAIQDAEAEQGVAQLLREQRRAEREAKRPKKPSRAALTGRLVRELEAVGAPRAKYLARGLAAGRDKPAAKVRELLSASSVKTPALRAALDAHDQLKQAVPF